MKEKESQEVKQPEPQIPEAQKPEQTESQESDSGGLGVCSVIRFFSVIFIDILDVVLAPLELTGGWLIVAFMLDIMTVIYFLGLSLACEGFSLKAIFSSWQQTIVMTISFASQFIPILDLLPGWATGVYATKILKLFGVDISKKTRTPTTPKTPKTP